MALFRLAYDRRAPARSPGPCSAARAGAAQRPGGHLQRDVGVPERHRPRARLAPAHGRGTPRPARLPAVHPGAGRAVLRPGRLHDEPRRRLAVPGAGPEPGAGGHDRAAAAGPDGRLPDDVGWPILLRACGAHESFIRTHGWAGEPSQVAEFLLLDRLFPRSVLHALATAEECLRRWIPRRAVPALATRRGGRSGSCASGWSTPTRISSRASCPSCSPPCRTPACRPARRSPSATSLPAAGGLGAGGLSGGLAAAGSCTPPGSRTSGTARASYNEARMTPLTLPRQTAWTGVRPGRRAGLDLQRLLGHHRQLVRHPGAAPRAARAGQRHGGDHRRSQPRQPPLAWADLRAQAAAAAAGVPAPTTPRTTVTPASGRGGQRRSDGAEPDEAARGDRPACVRERVGVHARRDRGADQRPGGLGARARAYARTWRT